MGTSTGTNVLTAISSRTSTTTTIMKTTRPLAIFLVCLFLGCFFKPGFVSIPEGLIKRLSQLTTPEEVRSWVSQVSSNRTTSNNVDRVYVPADMWPTWLKTITTNNAPSAVFIRVTNSPSLSVVWGHSRGLHGLEVNTSSNTATLSGKEFHVEVWTPGIYAWHVKGE